MENKQNLSPKIKIFLKEKKLVLRLLKESTHQRLWKRV